MRKFATVLALSLAATHGLPTPRSSIAKKDEAKDVDASRFLRGISIVNFVRKPLSDGSDFRHCEDEDEDSEDPRDEARSPYIRERPGKNQTKNTEQNSACSSSPLLAPP